jgi:hypothetical protein
MVRIGDTVRILIGREGFGTGDDYSWLPAGTMARVALLHEERGWFVARSFVGDNKVALWSVDEGAEWERVSDGGGHAQKFISELYGSSATP